MTGFLAQSHPTQGARSFGLVPFGTYTRTITLAQLAHVGTVTVALLIIALTLDLASRIEDISGHAGNVGPFRLMLHILWYVVLRICDILGNLLPLGAFLGVFWFEISLTQSRERIIIANGGRSPLQSLVPIVLLGIAFGAVQTVSLTVLRPAAISVHIETGLGWQGRSFDRKLKPTERHWLILPNQMVQARIDYLASTLVDVDLFQLSEGGRLASRLTAARAIPAREPGRWLFQDGSQWIAPEGGEPATPENQGTIRRFAELELAVPLDPLWLANRGIPARFLPQATLSDLAGRPDVTDPSYRTAWHVRMAQSLLPFGMMLLAMALASALIGRRLAFREIILIGLAGYFLHVSNNVVVWLGEYGQFPPVLAAWSMPLAMIATGFAIILHMERAARR